MTSRSPELADVVRLAGERLRSERRLTYHQHGILNSIARCRTAELGGHTLRCHDCHHEQIAYNSCRDRHCPKCQASARMRWTEARTADLLPVNYFHVVFTLPEQFSQLALQNKRLVYGILFQATAETLREIAADPRHLGADIGFLAVLHTWGQNLMHHPHLHCVVPAGGLSAGRDGWVSPKKRKKAFFLPVRVLSKVFRGKFIHYLKKAYVSGKLEFHGDLAELAAPQSFNALLDESVRRRWVVYAKQPFGGPEQVLKYLARYTHRVAISNSRLLAANERDVTFRWKNYANGSRQETMTLDAVEFLRRFLLHSLPKRFHRIRQFGFLSNRHRGRSIVKCRALISGANSSSSPDLIGSIVPTKCVPEEKPEVHSCVACGSHRVLLFDVPARQTDDQLRRPHFLSRLRRVELDSS